MRLRCENQIGRSMNSGYGAFHVFKDSIPMMKANLSYFLHWQQELERLLSRRPLARRLRQLAMFGKSHQYNSLQY